MKRFLRLSALAILFFGCATPAPEEGGPPRDVTIHYLPFGVETYVPVTPDTIEEQATCRLAVSKDDGLVARLREAVAAAEPGAFDNKVVRLKATGSLDWDVFIDRDGGLLLNRGGEERRLSPRELSDLETHLWFRRVSGSCETKAASQGAFTGGQYGASVLDALS